MIFGIFPLVDKYNDKKGRHAKINSLQLKRNELTEHTAHNASENPVKVAEKGDKKHRILFFFTRKVQRAVDRIRFVGQCLDHVPFAAFHFTKVSLIVFLSIVLPSRLFGWLHYIMTFLIFP